MPVGRVTAVWHRPQKSEISDGLHENRVLVNASQPLTTTTGLNGFPQSARGMVANLKLPTLGISPRFRGGGCQNFTFQTGVADPDTQGRPEENHGDESLSN